MFLASALPSAKDIEKEIAELQKQVDNVKRLGTDTFDITTPLPMNLSQAYWMLANQYKPLEVVRKLTLPILVLQGERDYQVTMQDFELWQSAWQSIRMRYLNLIPDSIICFRKEKEVNPS